MLVPFLEYGWAQKVILGNCSQSIEVSSRKLVEFYVVEIFSFGLAPGAQLHVPSPLPANQSTETSLLISTSKNYLGLSYSSFRRYGF